MTKGKSQNAVTASPYNAACIKWGEDKRNARLAAGVGFTSEEAKAWSEQYNLEHPYPVPCTTDETAAGGL